MIDSAFEHRRDRQARAASPLAPSGSRSTYSRIAWARNSSASRATTSGDGCCSARKRIELSSHSASPPTTSSVSSGGSASSKRMVARLRRPQEAAPDFGLLAVGARRDTVDALGGRSSRSRSTSAGRRPGAARQQMRVVARKDRDGARLKRHGWQSRRPRRSACPTGRNDS